MADANCDRAERGIQKIWLVVVSGVLALLAAAFPMLRAGASTIDVTQHHNTLSRSGLYIDPAFTQAACTNLKRDLSFSGTIDGEVYAQPLYLDDGPGGIPAVIAVTESNNVYALDAAHGTILWQMNAGPATPMSVLPCGDINPVGIVGTPVVDLPSRTLCFDALTSGTGGVAHLIYALDLDTGAVESGWPVNVDASVSFNGNQFASLAQQQRGALTVVGGIVYVAYGGMYGDCGSYNGWLVGVPLDEPTNVLAWCTSANGGGAWAVSGVASDGTNVYIATGNTFNTSVWSGGEAVIRFQPGPVFSQQTKDYWAATNWYSLDGGDLDVGSSGTMLLNVPGATPSSLMIAMGKDGSLYLLNRTNLGGIVVPVARTKVATVAITQAAATYQTASGTYVVCNPSSSGSGTLTALKIGAANPPTIATAWTRTFNGRGSPFVTSTDGTNNMTVWVIGSEGDQRLHGFDGNTGNTVFAGGGANELMTNTRRYNTAVAAHGRIYVANDNQVCAFSLPVSSIMLTNATISPDGQFQCSFTNFPGMSFTGFGTTNVSLPFADWVQLGPAEEVSPGQFQFTDPSFATNPLQFYRLCSP
jgi:hypothetical protein